MIIFLNHRSQSLFRFVSVIGQGFTDISDSKQTKQKQQQNRPTYPILLRQPNTFKYCNCNLKDIVILQSTLMCATALSLTSQNQCSVCGNLQCKDHKANCH